MTLSSLFSILYIIGFVVFFTNNMISFSRNPDRNANDFINYVIGATIWPVMLMILLICIIFAIGNRK